MLLSSDRLQDIPILSLQTGSPLAYTVRPLIDPRRLYITAFYCNGPSIKDDTVILHTTDIREFSDFGMIVDDSDSIMSPEGLVRLQEVINYDFSLIDMKVVDTHQKKLGKVIGYSVESESFLIKKIIIKRPLLQSLHDNELLIGREQIVEMTLDTIIVRAPTIEVKHSENTTQQSSINPFRKTDPQIEG